MQRTDDRIYAWRRHASQLAEWVFARLVNRVDAWGAYVAPSRRNKMKSYTAPRVDDRGQVQLTPFIVSAHFGSFDQGNVIGLHTASADGLCKWGAIDIDHHGEVDPATAKTHFEAAQFWYDVLVSLGFTPLLTDSNGKGGFHLRVLFSRPVPIARVYWFLRWLTTDYRSHKLSHRPETYPRQAELPAGGFGNWLRLPGQHHTDASHWSRVWDGERWLEGADAIAAILSITGDSPALIPAEAVAPKPRALPARRPLSRDDAAAVVNRCMAYIGKMPDAISGQRGHDRTFNLACEIFRFGLDGGDARSVFDWINATKTGSEPWDEKQIDHKLADAKSRVLRDGEFGIRLQKCTKPAGRRTLTVAPLRCEATK